jgi:hypothetical protein
MRDLAETVTKAPTFLEKIEDLHAVFGQAKKYRRGGGMSITPSRAMEPSAYQRRIHLKFIRSGKPIGNGFIKGFNGRAHEECLKSRCFQPPIS